MKKLTIPAAKKYITENYGQPRHNIKSLVLACRKVGKREKVEPLKLFHLLIENQPIPECYTHSYGFHTGNGRHLIESVQSAYYQINNNLTSKQVLILN